MGRLLVVMSGLLLASCGGSEKTLAVAMDKASQYYCYVSPTARSVLRTQMDQAVAPDSLHFICPDNPATSLELPDVVQLDRLRTAIRAGMALYCKNDTYRATVRLLFSERVTDGRGVTVTCA